MGKDYILVLPSWYPDKYDKFNGDFNERLVNAVALKHKQIVVYVTYNKYVLQKEIEVFETSNLVTYKAYCKYSRFDILNLFGLVRLYLEIFKKIFKQYGLPKIVHNYVFFPAGIISIYLKYRYNLKVVLTEHWSIFNIKNNPKNIETLSFYRKAIYYLILQVFDSIISVSDNLNESLSKWSRNSRKYIMPNVVDINYFNRQGVSYKEKFTFIHVSDMSRNKNVLRILAAFKNVLDKGLDINLKLVGKKQKDVIMFVKENSLSRQVSILGELKYSHVAEQMKLSDCFVLFSNYENLPCVILEALCCGLPVISSNVGGVPSLINENNGILVDKSSLNQLQNAMLGIVNNYSKFNNSTISQNAISKYNYDLVSESIIKVYNETTETNSYFNR